MPPNTPLTAPSDVPLATFRARSISISKRVVGERPEFDFGFRAADQILGPATDVDHLGEPHRP